MNLTTTLTALSALVVLGTAAPQQKTLQPLTQAPLSGGVQEEFDAAEWATRLGDKDLGQRMAAYDELSRRAAHDPRAYEQVRAWAAHTANTELSWTSQLLLRELDSDPFTSLRRGRPFGSGLFGGGDPFERMQEWMDQLHHGGSFGLRQPGQPFGSPIPGLSLGPGGSMQSKSFGMQLGPDGVSVEVEEYVNGEKRTRTYEAESLEALLEAHPDLEGKIGGGGTFSWGGADRGRTYQPFGGSALDPDGEDQGGLRRLQPLRPSLDRLGVRMMLPANRTQEYAGVADDTGLQVMDVLPGSLADFVGIQDGDLVIEIEGQAIRSAEDVQAALSKASLDERIEVLCVTPDGKRRVRAWEPAAEDEDERSF